jgi:hypothetical protein
MNLVANMAAQCAPAYPSAPSTPPTLVGSQLKVASPITFNYIWVKIYDNPKGWFAATYESFFQLA